MPVVGKKLTLTYSWARKRGAKFDFSRTELCRCLRGMYNFLPLKLRVFTYTFSTWFFLFAFFFNLFVCSVIDKCDRKGLYFKTRNLKEDISPYQFVFVIERILEPETETNAEVVEEREVLFAFSKAENVFSPGETYRLLDDIYRKLTDVYKEFHFDVNE